MSGDAYWLWVKLPDGTEERFSCFPGGLGMFQYEPIQWKDYLEHFGLKCRIEKFETEYDNR